MPHLVWIVGNTCGRDSFEEFCCWELGRESVHVFVDQGGQGNALLVKVEDNKDVVPGLVDLLDVVNSRDLPNIAVSKILVVDFL